MRIQSAASAKLRAPQGVHQIRGGLDVARTGRTATASVCQSYQRERGITSFSRRTPALRPR